MLTIFSIDIKHNFYQFELVSIDIIQDCLSSNVLFKMYVRIISQPTIIGLFFG